MKKENKNILLGLGVLLLLLLFAAIIGGIVMVAQKSDPGPGPGSLATDYWTANLDKINEDEIITSKVYMAGDASLATVECVDTCLAHNPDICKNMEPGAEEECYKDNCDDCVETINSCPQSNLTENFTENYDWGNPDNFTLFNENTCTCPEPQSWMIQNPCYQKYLCDSGLEGAMQQAIGHSCDTTITADDCLKTCSPQNKDQCTAEDGKLTSWPNEYRTFICGKHNS